MPTPEELGLGRPKREEAAAIDWNQVDRQLQQLGAISSTRQKLSQGGYSFTVVLPTAQPNRVQNIEAVAPTEAQAVQNAFAKIAELRR